MGFTRYVDDYRFFGKTITDLELVRNMLVKVFRSHELSFNEAKIKLFKGFEVQKQAHFENYPALRPIIKGNWRTSFSFDKYQIIHENLSLMIDNADIPTLKAALTGFKNKIVRGKIQFKNDQIVLSFLEFLIKVAYVLPLVCMQTYKLIAEIVNTIAPAIRHRCWKRLYAEFEYIRENYSDTDLEIWYFYVLSEAGTSRETSTVVSKYLKKNDNLSPILLTVLIKPRSKAGNTRIESILSSQVDDWQTASQSKWWLPLSKLWIDSSGLIRDREIRKLFLSINKSNHIQWNKLGIIEFLRQQTTETQQNPTRKD